MKSLKDLSNDELLEYKKLLEEFERNKNSRSEDVRRNRMDCKFAYHVVRLLNEVEQILTTGDIDLEQDRERLKAIRRGEWTKEQVMQHFTDKEKQLEEVYNSNDSLPYKPNVDEIENLLFQCLEEHYGSLSSLVTRPQDDRKFLQQIRTILDKAGV